MGQQHLTRLGKENAKQKSAKQRDRRRQNTLPYENAREIPLAHAENIVKPELTLSSTNQK